MARFFMSWEIVRERLAEDPVTIATGWQMLVGMVKADLEEGKLKEWGSFPGDLGGYSVIEGNELDVMKFTMKYAPYVAFKVRPVVDIGTVGEFLSSVSG